MITKIIQLVALSMIILSCEENGKDNNSDTYSYEYVTASMIVTKYDTVIHEYTLQDSNYLDTSIFVTSEIKEGDHMVFEYHYIYSDEAQIADDEYSERILLEIPADQESFIYTDEELHELNTTFDYYCFCPLVGLVKADSGIISGKKIDENKWKIEINARFSEQDNNTEYSFEKWITVSEVFTFRQ